MSTANTLEQTKTAGVDAPVPEFRSIVLADKQWIQPLFDMSGFRSEEYNFGFCYIWRDVFHYQAARLGDRLLLKAEGEKRKPSYAFPPGSGDPVPAIEAMMRDAQAAGYPFTFHIVLEEERKLLEVLYPDKFEFRALTDYFDYVYDAESLITLRGKKLHSKRNHVNRFKQSYPDWAYEEITPENMPEVIKMSEEWCIINECHATQTGHDEACAVHRALTDFFSLDMDGGLIRTGGKVVAFSIGERLTADTYLVHIEKAFSEYQGSYTIINQEFAARNCEGYLYIDREDDSGQPGLRKAKLSYRPAFMVEKYAARLK